MDEIFTLLFCYIFCCDEDNPVHNNYDKIYDNDDNDTKIKRN